jgi:S-methylmethionine-dependent homocysteine/selenocysteine methylase
LSGDIFLTDGGLETDLIFHDGADLPHFAAFVLLTSEHGLRMLKRYYRRDAALAVERDLGFILESPTWRASADWGARLGYDAGAMAALNKDAIGLMMELRDEFETPRSKFVVSGCIGPRGDGYDPGELMSVAEARDYHAAQVRAFAEAGADMVTAITMTSIEEATGLAQASREAGMPCAVSFTVETDGRLPSGAAIGDAIVSVDAATGSAPAYYMINCAHPTHFEGALQRGEAWLDRIGGVRANASTKSHAELDQSETLDEGDPGDLGRRFGALRRRMPRLTVLGGCCGTDHRHIAAIRDACTESRAAA